MKNHLTKLPFFARATRAAGAGFKGWVNTLAGRRDRPRRAPAPRPPRAQRDEVEAMNVLGLLHLKCRGIPRASPRITPRRAAGTDGRPRPATGPLPNGSIAWRRGCPKRATFYH
jgi:hypothetical protein